MSAVSVLNISKYYQQITALDDVSIDFQEGELFALLGPSGSGKTTLLRSIAGFVQPDKGTIYFDQQLVDNIPVHKRAIGMMFQNYALFPHLTVFDNIAFGLSVRGIERKLQRQKVDQMLELVQLGGLEKRKPRQLSGGQQQRVALARALITQPKVLLLDEPLSALDKRLRQEMQLELKQIQRELGLTTIFVTHDQEEALTLSDRVAIINHGEVVQLGEPEAVYEKPQTVFAANFLGDANFFSGTVTATHQVDTKHGILQTTAELPAADDFVTLAVRPEKITLQVANTGIADDLVNRLPGTIRQVVYSGSSTSYIVVADDAKYTVFEQNRNPQSLAAGTAVVMAWSAQHTIIVKP